MPDNALSRIDLNILKNLKQDGRAELCGDWHGEWADHNTLQRARKTLGKRRFHLGYHAQLNPEKLGKGLVVFVQITLQRTAGNAFKDFTDAIRAIPEVEECHLVAGNFDYLIKARVRDMTDYRAFLGGSLMQLPGVQESTSYPVMEALPTAALSCKAAEKNWKDYSPKFNVTKIVTFDLNFLLKVSGRQLSLTC